MGSGAGLACDWLIGSFQALISIRERETLQLLRRGGYNACHVQADLPRQATCGTVCLSMFADRTKWNLAPNRLSVALERHRAAGKPLVDLTASNPTECGFAYDQGAILEALGNPAALRYEPAPRGLASARQAVCKYYVAHGARADVDDIFLTTSTSEAYSYVFRLLCNPGDEVLIPAPSYPLFDFLAEIQDTKLVRYPLIYDHGWEIDFHSLERAITPRTRAMIVVHPNNPTGHFTKRSEIQKLNVICAARGLALMVDEVFLDFRLAGEKPASFADNRGALTFTLSGLSKICGLPQMKAAWVLTSGPLELRGDALARLELIADTYLSMNAPVQLALPSFLAQRRTFQEQTMARIRRNLAELDRQLALQTVSSRLELEGGWYAVLRVPATHSDEDLAVTLLEDEGVYVHPGHFYDFSSGGYLVLSLLVEETSFSQGLAAIVRLFH
jgi:aspartate/methionine/tyrosine aminotransferase